MSSWSLFLPRDIRNYISSYLDQYNEFYPVIDNKKFLIEYYAEDIDTDKNIKDIINLQKLYCEYSNFTDKGLSYLINLQELNCLENSNFTITGLFTLTNLKVFICGNNIFHK